MPTQTEIDAAADRLRRVKSGENPVDVYGTDEPPAWFKLTRWALADARELAAAGIESDQEDLADAYLALGTRQPEQFALIRDDGTRGITAPTLDCAIDVNDISVSNGYQRCKIIREVVFVEEVQQ